MTERCNHDISHGHRAGGAAVGLGGLALMACVLAPSRAIALPSFAAQTDQPCAACHIGAYGPQLTPNGRAFKIGGYTQSGGEGWAARVPLSIMALGSFTNTGASVPNDQRENRYASNNNFNFDQLSVFLAGGFGEHSGALVQYTAANNLSASKLDNTDIRPFTTVVDVGGDELRIGTTINNNPTVQDPYNTTFAWGFPYVSSALAPTPAAQPVIAGAFAGNTMGATAYLWYDRRVYFEGGIYNTQSPWLLARTGNFFGAGSTSSLAPYLRAAYEWNWNGQSAHVGALFLQSNVNPTVAPRQTDGSFGGDSYNDYAFDASYAFLGDGTHIGTIQGIYTHETQSLNGTANSFNAANGTGFGNSYALNQIRMNASYWYTNTYGVTLGWQRTWGPANPLLYGPAEVSGSNNSKPNSNAFIVEADWVPFGKADSWMGPWVNLKVGVQYVAYTQFNGGKSNYDGFGRSAGDNNSLFLFGWMAF
jgi:hypothetical protein